jgi:hypothetical protein
MHRLFIGFVVACVMAASAASADDFTPLPNLGDTVLDLDTASGNFSAWQIHDIGTINAIRTTLQIRRLGSDPDWLPSFWINVGNSNEQVSFRIFSETRRPPLAIHLMRYAGKDLADDRVFASTVGLNENLDVSISWTPQGSVTVRLGGGETHTTVLRSAVTSVQIGGSTGQVKFNPLRIGHAS